MIGIVGSASAGAPVVDGVRIVRKKDLRIDPKTGHGAFAWRPDSKAIAYVKFWTGDIGIVDVATGREMEIPNLQMNGVQALSWSVDGGLLALNSHTELERNALNDDE